MKNKLSDLNDHLFETIEWLCDRDMKGEELQEEIARANAVCSVAEQIIQGGKLVLDAAKASDHIPGVGKLPLLLK